jgi:hypothetical protein
MLCLSCSFSDLLSALLFSAIGANILDLYYTSHIYWFLMGYIANAKINYIWIVGYAQVQE